MGESYRQPCKNGPCWMCSGKGVVTGNGAALANPMKTRSALAYEPTGRAWDDVVRASEDAA